MRRATCGGSRGGPVRAPTVGRMDPVTLIVTGDPQAALATVTGALQSLGYSVQPDPSGWRGRAEVGSKAARALAGGFSRRMVLDYTVTQAQQPGAFQVVVAPATSGWSGGALGASKAKKELQSVGSTLWNAFATQGTLGGQPQPPGQPPG